jgi:NADH-quinone oxidoreductase subunit L
MLLLYMWSLDNTLVFEQILAPANMEHLAAMVVTVPLLNITTPAIALIAVLIFFGTIGKSAQFPLHVWLPMRWKALPRSVP